MPCKPRLTGCAASCLHRQLVETYRDSRHSWEERRETSEHLQMEDDDYRAAYPPPTFKQWLIGHGRGRP
jgi:hypothetical protein